MTAKEYLNQAYKIDCRIKIIDEKIKRMKSLAVYKSPSFDGTGGSSVDKGENYIKIIEYEQRQNNLRDLLVDKRLEIENTIGSVQNAIQREVLERRYLLYQQWESRFDERTGVYIKGIAESMRYSDRQIFRIHGEALKKVAVNVSECQ